jgi:GNAT superfamily N-acetyltransferase
VGFVHVLELDGHAHLEQLSVRPEAQRQGVGTDLVRAAMHEARRDGHRWLSLCTYRDVAFNGPFYATLGFEESTDLLPFQQQLREHETEIGLDVDGPRIVMSVALRP